MLLLLLLRPVLAALLLSEILIGPATAAEANM
jgi:hypothetical protein